MSRKSKKSRNNKKGGSQCGTTTMLHDSTCFPSNNLDIYKYPCPGLTSQQFALHQENNSYNQQINRIQTAGRRNRSCSTKHRGGDCGIPKPHCLGQIYPNLGKTTISDGNPNDMATMSEQAWFMRYADGLNAQGGGIYGKCLTKSRSKSYKRNKRNQKGGLYRLNIGSPPIGGLTEVISQPLECHNIPIHTPASIKNEGKICTCRYD